MGRQLATSKRESTSSARHLRWETFEARIARPSPSVESVKGSPGVHLFVEHAGSRIGARFFVKDITEVPSPLEEIMIREVRIGSASALELSTGTRELYRDFYALCCTIADKVQVGNQPVPTAVTETLASWASLVRRKTLISHNRQIGLLGELLFLRRVAQTLGWPTAAKAWLGPDTEEHDFALPFVDVEVKTTTREQRIHEICSLTQMQPKHKRQLYLLSMQLTLAGGSKDAFSLSSTVAEIVSAGERASPRAAELIRNQITQQGWVDEDAEFYNTLYCTRSRPMVVKVSEEFPRIVPQNLSALCCGSGSRIENVSYSINVDGLGALEGSGQFERALFYKKK